jgi:hypothetical protein
MLNFKSLEERVCQHDKGLNLKLLTNCIFVNLPFSGGS